MTKATKSVSIIWLLYCLILRYLNKSKKQNKSGQSAKESHAEILFDKFAKDSYINMLHYGSCVIKNHIK